MERLQKRIANNSTYSRRKAEELIASGNVKVNGEVVYELGTKVSDKDEIKVNNKTLFVEDKVYFLLNKPKGYISSKVDERKRPTVVDIITRLDKNKHLNIYPVGRLDYNTTGLLLLTNDGEITNLLTHPRNHIAKTYVAKVIGDIKKFDILKLKDGVEIDGKKTQKCKVSIMRFNAKTNTYKVKLTIHEGRNHQVKKMFEAIGGKVIDLKRTDYAFLNLEGVKVGEFRELTIKEIRQLYGMNKNGNKQ